MIAVVRVLFSILLIAVGCGGAILLVISPGVGVNWLFHRFGGDLSGILWASIRDAWTWGISILLWGSIGCVVYRTRRRRANRRQRNFFEEFARTAASEDFLWTDRKFQARTKRHTTKAAETSDSPKDSEKSPPSEDLYAMNDHSAAKILGLKGRVTMNDVQVAWRLKIQEYHPDKVASLGTKLKATAESESKLINAAYSYFKTKHGSKGNANNAEG